MHPDDSRGKPGITDGPTILLLENEKEKPPRASLREAHLLPFRRLRHGLQLPATRTSITDPHTPGTDYSPNPDTREGYSGMPGRRKTASLTSTVSSDFPRQAKTEADLLFRRTMHLDHGKKIKTPTIFKGDPPLPPVKKREKNHRISKEM